MSPQSRFNLKLKSSFNKLRRWLYPYRPRFEDWRFWAIQSLIIIIAAAHVFLEFTGVLSGLGRLYFVPISLLILPVVYAAMNFGFAGAIGTAVWVIIITIPNLVFEHQGWERWGEAFQLVILTAVAMFMGQRVDWERKAQRRAEEAGAALKISETKYRRLFESSPMAVLVLDSAGTILEANPTAGSLFGSPVEVLKGSPFEALVGRETARELLSDSNQVNMREVILSFRLKDGSPIFLEPTLTRVLDSQRNVVIQVVLKDITQERNRQAGLRAYAASVLRVQEEERQHIARELHDETIQSLALLCRQLDGIKDGDTLPPSATSELQSARTTVEQVVKGLRDFTRALRPPILDDLGIVASIRRLLVDFTERTGVEGELEVAGKERRLPPDAELGIFRIAQEALWNVEHHARASHVTVTITFGENEARLDVLDNGAGFNVPAHQGDFASSGKLGLIGMWERAELLGGKLEIKSSPGKGTKVTASIPLGLSSRLLPAS